MHVRHAPLALVDTLLATTDPVRTTYLQGRPLLVLSGTRNLRDVLDDLDVRASAFETRRSSTVHRGMFRRALRCSEEVQEFALAHASIDLVGWSLGGGAAVHLASILHVYGVDVTSVAVFGAPRCGDRDFAKWYREAGLCRRTVRYETPRDPVVTLPPGTRYVHVGRRRLVPCQRTGPLAHHDLHAYRDGLLGGKSSCG